MTRSESPKVAITMIMMVAFFLFVELVMAARSTTQVHEDRHGPCQKILNIKDRAYTNEAVFAIDQHNTNLPKDEKLTLISVDEGCNEKYVLVHYDNLNITASSKSLGRANYLAVLSVSPFGTESI
ncbi:hypothetical protein LINPERPRIM_LOCUS26466, partial [Linum perenne]